MTDAPNQIRYQLALGKFRVEKIEKGIGGVMQIALRINKDSFIIFSPPPNSDVREGDILTLYTEVLAHERSPTSSERH